MFSNLLDTTEEPKGTFSWTALFISLGLLVGLLTTIIVYLKLRHRRPRLPGNQSKLTNRVAFAFREFKRLRQLLKRKHPIKIEPTVKLTVLRLFHVSHVVQAEVHFRLLDTNGFPVKARNERFTVAG